MSDVRLTPTQKTVLEHLKTHQHGSVAFVGRGRAGYISAMRALARKGLLIKGDRNCDYYINDAGRAALENAEPPF